MQTCPLNSPPISFLIFDFYMKYNKSSLAINGSSCNQNHIYRFIHKFVYISILFRCMNHAYNKSNISIPHRYSLSLLTDPNRVIL